MIRVEKVSFRYTKEPVLREVSAAFAPGRIYSIIGPNGCGKTTLIRLLCRLAKPEQGGIFLEDKPAESYGRFAYAKKVAFMPQERITPDLPVYEVAASARFPYLDLTRRLTAADRAAVEAALEQTELAAFAERNMQTLSGGERQRVYLAALIAQDTPYVLLDEPITYLDIAQQFAVVRQMEAMRAEGRCVIAVLHDLAMALRCSDQVLVMRRGAVCAMDTPAQIVANGVLEQVFGVCCTPLATEHGTEYTFAPR